MHRIQEHDKQQGVAMAWHGLTEVRDDLTLENNWLAEWDIKPAPLSVSGAAAGQDHDIPTNYSILQATDNPDITIGVPFNPESYRPITNAEFLQLLRDSTSGSKARLASVGSVRNRGRVFATFQLEQLGEYKAGGRVFKPFLNFGNGHDKSSVLWANTSNTATVCDNTFQMNLDAVEREILVGTRQRHTKNVALRLPEMGALVAKAVGANRDFAMAFEAMAGVAVSPESAERILTGFVAYESKVSISTRAQNIIARLMELFRSGRGNHGQTLADLFSAVTEYYTHESAGAIKNPSRQFASSEFGNSSDKKRAFYAIVSDPESVAKTEKKGADLIQSDKESQEKGGE